MFTSQDHWNVYLIHVKAIKQDIIDCLDLLYRSEHGKFYENVIVFDDEFDITVGTSKGIVKGIIGYNVLIELRKKGKFTQFEYNINHYLFLINDYVGILERIQILLDKLSIPYKNKFNGDVNQ